MLRHLNVRQKFALIALIFSVPSVILLILFSLEKNKSIEFARREQIGNAGLQQLRRLSASLAELRAGGDQRLLQETGLAFDAAVDFNRNEGAPLGLNAEFRELEGRWNAFKSGWANADENKRQSLFDALDAEVFKTYSVIGYKSNLLLDADSARNLIAEQLSDKLPEQARSLGQIKTIGARILSAPEIDLDDRANVTVALGFLAENLRTSGEKLNSRLSAGRAETLRAVSPQLDGHKQITTSYLEAANTRFVSDNGNLTSSVSTAALDSLIGKAAASNAATSDALSKALSKSLETQINDLLFETYAVYAVVLLIAALVALFAWRTIKSVVTPLKEAVQISEGLAKGVITAPVAVNSRDEVGQLLLSMNEMTAYLQEMAVTADKIADGDLSVDVVAKSENDRFGIAFQNMLDRTLRLVQSQGERDQLQGSIMKLLEEVADVANGDLTVEAEVTPSATGAIADAFNFMIAELRLLIGQVQNTTVEVDSTTNRVQHAAAGLVERGEAQTAQLAAVAVQVEKMTYAMGRVSGDINLSAQVADQSLNNAQQGTVAVANYRQAIGRIEGQLQEASTRIERLGERSQEISQIVKIIDDLAHRTSILALNASIQASAAGETGRGFSMVAEEVERLAERSTQASKQIDALTKAIQGETNAVVVATEATIREVAAGTELAGEAGKALEEIENVSRRLATLSYRALSTTAEQAAASQAVTTTMREIAAASRQTTDEIKDSAATITTLTALAQNLRSSVSSFRLPADALGAEDTTTNSDDSNGADDAVAAPDGYDHSESFSGSYPAANGNSNGNGNGSGSRNGNGSDSPDGHAPHHNSEVYYLSLN